MLVLRCMKVGCVVTAVLGAMGYMLLLIPMVDAMCEPRQFLKDIGEWLWKAQPPLVVILLSAIGYCMCGLADRFMIKPPMSADQLDFDDRAPRPTTPPAGSIQ